MLFGLVVYGSFGVLLLVGIYCHELVMSFNEKEVGHK